ncbi:MAG: DedA family protein [bacterium]
MSDSPTQVTEWLDLIFSYGSVWVYLALFIACFIENIFPPFPGDTFIVVTGGLISAQRLEPVMSVFLILAGGLASVMIMFSFGRRYGRDYFMKKNYKYFSSDDIIRFEKSLPKWGAMLLMFSRFVVGFRSIIAIGAGIGKFHPVKMFFYSLISYILFSGLLLYLGYTLIENYDRITYYIKTYNIIAWPLIIGSILVIIVWKIIKVRKKTQ